jgi:hypothetical protein
MQHDNTIYEDFFTPGNTLHDLAMFLQNPNNKKYDFCNGEDESPATIKINKQLTCMDDDFFSDENRIIEFVREKYNDFADVRMTAEERCFFALSPAGMELECDKQEQCSDQK